MTAGAVTKAATPILLAFVAFVACSSRKISSLDPIPILGDFPASAVIQANADFLTSSAIGGPGCEVWLIGARWGTLLRISASGRILPVAIRIPGNRIGARFENVVGTRVAVSAQSPELLGYLDFTTAKLDSVRVPENAWGQRWVGPLAQLSDGGFALAWIGEKTRPRRQPSPWADAPLIQILDAAGVERSGVDRVVNRGGLYLSWLMSVQTIGANLDTLRALDNSSAMLRIFVRNSGSNFRLIHERQLPRYFVQPKPAEQVAEIPWIQIGGEQLRFMHLPHVSTATFGPTGKLYAVRTYDATWRRINRSPVLPPGGTWEVDAEGLEIYSPSGDLLGAYRLPADIAVSWIRVDNDGRLYLGGGGGNVRVAVDPTDSAPRCSIFANSINIRTADLPDLRAASQR